MNYIYCANCIAENNIQNSANLYIQKAVTMLGGAALCLKCFWLKAHALKEERRLMEEQVAAFNMATEAMGELKKSL